jgi:hypothetical protein
MLRTVLPGSGGTRRRRSILALLVGLSLFLSLPAAAGAQVRPADERLQKLEAEVTELRAEIAALNAATKPTPESAEPAAAAPPGATVDELSRRIDLLAAEIERLQLGEAAPEATQGEKGLGPAASKIYRTAQGLAIGGYGDLLYQHFASRRDDGSPSGETDTLDLERAVVYFGYKLSDRFLFNSELEFEHAKTEEGAEGEAAIEFAYLDYLYKPALNFRAGLVLMPMGFLNELHEPTTFFSTERPLAERVVIPTTWRENGFGLFGDAGSFTYRAYVVNGMDATRYEGEEGLAEGKQEGSLAKAEDFAVVGRLDYQGVPGLLVGASAYGGDAGQDLRDEEGRSIGVRTTLVEGHLEWRSHGLQLRVFGVRAKLADVAALDRALGLAGDESVGEALDGGYVEVGYDVLARRGGATSLTPFARWEGVDTQARVPAGYRRDPANRRDILTLGVAWKPIDRVVVKADWQDVSNDAQSGLDQINVGIGYVF